MLTRKNLIVLTYAAYASMLVIFLTNTPHFQFLLPAKQSMSSSFPSSAGLNQFNEITYPMFVFCRGKSSEQQVDLPPRPVYRSPPAPPPLTAGHPAYASSSQLQNGEDDDDDDEDEAIEFVIV